MIRNTRLTQLIVFVILITNSLGEKTTEEFFEQFGYLPERSGKDRTQAVSPERLEKAISKFQEFNGLKVTGILDDMTKKEMFKPRCGVKDFSADGAAYRKITKWKKNDLTWSVRDFSRTARLSRTEQLNAIRKAFNHWSSVTPLTFREVPHGGDIVIRFAAGNHGDGNSFDGPGSVLAHAFFPSNGDTHFDDAEKWTLRTEDGINLEIVAAHEFGHALGLAHSQVRSALMAPYYKGYTPNFKLDNDDIRGIQSLYGVRRRVTRPTSPPTTTRRRVHYDIGYCRYRYTKISAIVRVLEIIDYVFVDQAYVISSKTGEMQRIRTVFKKGPSRVDAAVYSKETNKVYLAYGYKIWAFTVIESGTRFTLDYGYPKRMGNHRVGYMDALVGFDMSYLNYNSVRLFILKGGRFWELIPKYNYVGGAYSITHFFQNIPKNYDTTLTVNDRVYFVSNNRFYQMKLPNRSVSSTGLPMDQVLLRCRND